MLELAMLVMGIVVLCRGRLSLSKTTEVRGPIARVVGLIMIAPVPIVVAYALATDQGADDGPFGNLLLIELGVVLACFILAMIVAHSNKEPKVDQARGRRDRFDDDHDDYDDRPRRRERDDDYDDRPRRRDRDDDYDDRDRR